MHATALLRQQHRKIEQLVDAITKGEGDTLLLLDELAAELPAHMSVEHACLYRVAATTDAPIVPEAFEEEHAIVELALKRLMVTTIGTEEFHARVTVLEELVHHQLKEEGTRLVAQLEATLGADELEALGAEMVVMHHALLEQASPKDRSGGSGTWPIVREAAPKKRARTA
jgi:hypothetical protein